jgi:hypothetical protein
VAHGKLWPAHPKPFPDELLSSWIVRIAEQNSIKLQTLSRLLFGERHTPWNRDIDRYAPGWLLNSICQYTGVDHRQAYNATLAVYAGRLYPRHTMAGQLRWILPTISQGTKRRGFSLQFCPACLAEDHIPYFRKQWRVALFTDCPIHKISLYDGCPACGAMICPFRRDFGLDVAQAPDLGFCTVCGFDLRKSPANTSKIPTDEICKGLDSMLLSVADVGRAGTSSEYDFFSTLHHLCRVMCMRQNDGRLQEFANNQIGQTHHPILLDSRAIEHLRIDGRRRLVSLGVWILIDPESRLTQAWRQRAVRYSLLVKEFTDRPKWYADVVGNFSDWRNSKFFN